MTQAFNLAQLANNVNTAGQVSATNGLNGVVPVANGGTGQSSLTANAVVVGNGTSGVTTVAPGASGNLLRSNGTSWTSSPGISIATTNGITGGTITSTGTIGLAFNYAFGWVTGAPSPSFYAGAQGVTSVVAVNISDYVINLAWTASFDYFPCNVTNGSTSSNAGMFARPTSRTQIRVVAQNPSGNVDFQFIVMAV